MPTIGADASNARQLIQLTKERTIWIGGYLFLLNKDGRPIAMLHGGVVFFHCIPGTERRLVNKFAANHTAVELPLVMATASHFDFLVGQALSTVGLSILASRKESK